MRRKQPNARCAAGESMPAGKRSPEIQHGFRAPTPSSTAPTAIFFAPRRRKQKNNSGIKRSEDAGVVHPAVAGDFLIPVVMVMMVVIIAVVMMVMVPIPPPPALVMMMMVLSNPRLAVRARVGSF